VAVEKSLNLRRRCPKIFLVFGVKEYVEPTGFDDHFGIVNKFRKHLIFNFTLELVFQIFDEVHHDFT
jgi:hypothetical protein